VGSNCDPRQPPFDPCLDEVDRIAFSSTDAEAFEVRVADRLARIERCDRGVSDAGGLGSNHLIVLQNISYREIQSVGVADAGLTFSCYFLQIIARWLQLCNC